MSPFDTLAFSNAQPFHSHSNIVIRNTNIFTYFRYAAGLLVTIQFYTSFVVILNPTNFFLPFFMLMIVQNIVEYQYLIHGLHLNFIENL